jgi:hypothetical protein
VFHVPPNKLLKPKGLSDKDRRKFLGDLPERKVTTARQRIITRRRFLRSGLAAPAIIAFLGDDWALAYSRGYAGYDIILQIGDSNSYAGLNGDGSACYDPAIDTVNPNCFEWRSDNRDLNSAYHFIAVCNQFHPLDYAPSGQPVVASAINGVGPGENAVKAWQTNFAAPGRKTMIVVLGVGGTGLCNTTNTTTNPAAWQATPVVGGEVATAIYKVNAALAQSPLNKLVVVFWTSGANDAIFEKSTGLSTATYQSQFQGLDTYLRANVVGNGASTFIWILQPLVPLFVSTPSTACPNTNAALSGMPAFLSKCGYIDPAGTGLAGNIVGQVANGIPYHLTGGSQRLIGNQGFINAYNSHS